MASRPDVPSERSRLERPRTRPRGYSTVQYSLAYLQDRTLAGTTHPFTPYASFHESFAYKPLTDLATKVFATVETIPPRATPICCIIGVFWLFFFLGNFYCIGVFFSSPTLQ